MISRLHFQVHSISSKKSSVRGHHQTRKVLIHYCPLINDVQIITGEDKVLIARLSSGHHPTLRAYLHQLDLDINLVCSKCKE